jgi:hypothetical protein
MNRLSSVVTIPCQQFATFPSNVPLMASDIRITKSGSSTCSSKRCIVPCRSKSDLSRGALAFLASIADKGSLCFDANWLTTSRAAFTTSPEIVSNAPGPRGAIRVREACFNNRSRSVLYEARNIQFCGVTNADIPWNWHDEIALSIKAAARSALPSRYSEAIHPRRLNGQVASAMRPLAK